MPQSCDGSAPAPWSFGASAGGFDTDIVLDGDAVNTRQTAASASAGRALTERAGWTVTGSWVTGGTVEDRDVRGGGALSAGLHYLALYERPRRPFLVLTGSGAGTARVRTSPAETPTTSRPVPDSRSASPAPSTSPPK
jgi:hypothetical protein